MKLFFWIGALLFTTSSCLLAQVQEKYFAVGLNLLPIVNNNYELTTDTYLSRHFDLIANIGICPDSRGYVWQNKKDEGYFDVFAQGFYIKAGSVYKFNIRDTQYLYAGLTGIGSWYRQTGKRENMPDNVVEVYADKGFAVGCGLVAGLAFKVVRRFFVDMGFKASLLNSRQSSFGNHTYTPGFGGMGIMPISKVKYLF